MLFTCCVHRKIKSYPLLHFKLDNNHNMVLSFHHGLAPARLKNAKKRTSVLQATTSDPEPYRTGVAETNFVVA